MLKQKPAWLRSAPLRSVLLPEPPVFRKYLGRSTALPETSSAAALPAGALPAFNQNNVALVWLRFFAGFGLAFEKSEMDAARELASAARAHGLKVAFTVSLGALVPETMLLEESESHNWLQVNQDGQHALAGAHSFRVRPCCNSESYLRFMERVCGAAVDAGADAVHFTDFGFNAEPDTCRCPLCVAAFREGVRLQYGAQEERTRQAGLARFGHNTFTHIRPPVFTARNLACAAKPESGGPHEQEWAKFKLNTLTACLARLSRGIVRRNPECAVGADILYPPRQAHIHAIGYAELLPHLDLISTRMPESEPPAAGASSAEMLVTVREFEVSLQTWETDLFSENKISVGEQTYAIYQTA